MTYKKLVRTINEVAGNLNLSSEQAAEKLRKAAAYANELAEFLEGDKGPDTIPFRGKAA